MEEDSLLDVLELAFLRLSAKGYKTELKHGIEGEDRVLRCDHVMRSYDSKRGVSEDEQA